MSEPAMIICPHCKHRQDIAMSVGRGPSSHVCIQCKRVMVALDRCCVICAYGDRPCSTPGQGGK